MKTKIQVVVIKDPQGNVWKTPKGKTSWSSVGAAKRAWNAHTRLDNGPNPYNSSLRSRRQGVWDKDAIGWSCEVLAEFHLIPIKDSEDSHG